MSQSPAPAARPMPVTAVSFAPSLPPERRAALLEALGDTGAPVLVRADDVVLGLPAAQGAVVIAGTHTTSGERVDGAWVLEQATRRSPAWAQAVAPFAALVPGADDGVLGVTDPVGLGPLVHTQGDGWAALSTSAVHVGRAVGAPLDADALLDLALTGTFVGTGTAFRSVVKLAAGEMAEVRAGRCTIRRYADALPPTAPGAAGGARVLADAVGAALDGRDHVVLELSGGLDSRLLLAATAREARAHMEAVTIGADSASDVQIAVRLAAALGIEHRTIRLDGLTDEDPAAVHQMALASAALHDCGASPLAHLVLDHADRLIGSAPRLSGQNGELARGFFYGGQPPWPRTTGPLIRGLERWRLTTNDAVEPSLFEPGVVEAAHERLTHELTEAFAGFPGPWLTATDHLYLRHRMQRWVGAAYWSACQVRPILAPFFDPRYLGWALAAPPADKRGSRLAAQVLCQLDPVLARVPLDDGLVPAELAQGGLHTRLDLLTRSARKLRAKVAQRRTAETRPPMAVADLATAVCAHWRRSGTTLERVGALPFIHAPAVAAILEGRVQPDAATTGYLVALETLVGDRR